jgi:hypothetical protein
MGLQFRAATGTSKRLCGGFEKEAGEPLSFVPNDFEDYQQGGYLTALRIGPPLVRRGVR